MYRVTSPEVLVSLTRLQSVRLLIQICYLLCCSNILYCPVTLLRNNELPHMHIEI